MPRLARRIAASGIYHVTLRGDGRRLLFENDSDKRKFLRLLERYGEEYGLKYLAWCLMDNHIHLLIHDPLDQLMKAMHDVNSTFARYFNERNDRVGSVFQNRYSSIPIETNDYLLKVMRYIHQNPKKAHLTDDLHYPWSSYDDYIRGGIITSTKMILEMLGGIDQFCNFCNQNDEDTYFAIEKEINGYLTDSEALEYAKRILGDRLFGKLQRLGKEDRDNCLHLLHRAGLPMRQIARITGIGRGIIQRACAKTIDSTEA